MCRFRHPAQFGLSFVSKLYPNAPLPSTGRAGKVVSPENIIKICSNLAVFMCRFLKHLCFFLPFCSIVERFGSPRQTKTSPLPCPVCVPFCNRRKKGTKKAGGTLPPQTVKKVPSSRHVRMDGTQPGKLSAESVRGPLGRVRGSALNFVQKGDTRGEGFLTCAAGRKGSPLERGAFATR